MGEIFTSKRLSLFAYDNNDAAAIADGLFRGSRAVQIGTGVNSMVHNVLGAASDGALEALHIIDHGVGSGGKTMVFEKRGRKLVPKLGPNGRPLIVPGGNANFEIGNDDITRDSFKGFEKLFQKLAPKFTQDGHVYLHNCYAGNDRELLRLLAGAFGVPVTASTEKVQGITGYQAGVMVTAQPNGNVTEDRSPRSGFFPR